MHAVVDDPDFVGSDATYDPRRSLLSERYPGTLAEQRRVPAANLVDKPAELSFAEAACLPTAWLTAYRMLFTPPAPGPGTPCWSRVPAGEWRPRWSCSAGSGPADLGHLPGRARGARAVDLGADRAFDSGRAAARAGRRGDGDRRRRHLVALGERPAAGRHPGDQRNHLGAEPAKAELTKIFFKPLRVIGSTMGTRDELSRSPGCSSPPAPGR